MLSQEFVLQGANMRAPIGTPIGEAALHLNAGAVITRTGELVIGASARFVPVEGHDAESVDQKAIPPSDGGALGNGGGEPPKDRGPRQEFYDPDGPESFLTEVVDPHKASAVRAFLDTHSAGHGTEYAALVAGTITSWENVAKESGAILNPKAAIDPSEAFDAAVILQQSFIPEAYPRLITVGPTWAYRQLALCTPGSKRQFKCGLSASRLEYPYVYLDPRAVARDPHMQDIHDKERKHMSSGLLLGSITFLEDNGGPYTGDAVHYYIYSLPGDSIAALSRTYRPNNRDNPSAKSDPIDHLLGLDEAQDVADLVKAVWGDLPKVRQSHPLAYHPS